MTDSVVFGHNLLESIPEDVHKLLSASCYIVVTDTIIVKLYGHKLEAAFKAAGLPCLLKVIGPGEAAKTRQTKEEIEDFMLHHNVDRQACIVALGGGVIGDLSGFVAATYLRGINFVQVPTTLLGMVDASVGGKTGLNPPAGKNLIGAFHQPKKVYMDLSLLASLSDREFLNGMGEVIKTGAIYSQALFVKLETSVEAVIARDSNVLLDIVKESVAIKQHVVSVDEKEKGLRMILNFGHTIGHGIEALLQPDWLHGECVAVGMVKETVISRALGFCNSATLNRLVSCIQAYKLPIHVPAHLNLDQVMTKMAVDKKNRNGAKSFVILKSIGKTADDVVQVDDATVMRCLCPGITVTPSYQPVNGTVSVPGSKSVSNRVLLMTALGEGTCRLKGLLHSDDTKVMLDALHKFGVRVDWESDGQTLIVHGNQGQLQCPQDDIYLGNAGTAARFLTTTATLLENGSCIVTGNVRMRERPIGDLVEGLRSQGAVMAYKGKDGCLPIEITGTGFKGGLIELSSRISSQYVSSVLISAPYAKEPVDLRLSDVADGEKPVSKPYIDMTIALMKQFGINVETLGTNRFLVPQGVYKNPAEFSVESDASSSTYPLALAAVNGGSVTVEGVGSTSVQGDSKFAFLLEKMNCKVTQTETSTTVEGPVDGMLKAIDIAMDDMTDSFMTAAVVMAFCPKGERSRITAISNQRVKECNRIAAMVENFGRCGITARELEDGIEVVGNGMPTAATASYNTIDHPALMDCYKDHRIAMSFGVFASKVPHIVITDQDCVDKTYPEYWDHLSTCFGIKLAGWQKRLPSMTSVPVNEKSPIILIGMRGAGKTTLAKVASVSLKKPSIDLDEVIEGEIQQSIREYVHSHGWAAFREKEKQVLQTILAPSSPFKGYIVSCGGGIVETEECRKMLAEQPLVIHIRRDLRDIIKYLGEDTARPSFGESIEDVWRKREPLYVRCSRYEFRVSLVSPQVGPSNGHSVVPGSVWEVLSSWDRVNDRFVRLLRQIADIDAPPLPGPESFFLSLTFSHVQDAIPCIEEITSGVEAVELRADLLHAPLFAMDNLALLRTLTDLPVIFTVRSQQQGGQFPNEEHTIVDLLLQALRAGVEFLDVEASLSVEAKKLLVTAKGNTKIISSYHIPKRPCLESELIQVFHKTLEVPGVDIVKVVTTAFQASDPMLLQKVAGAAQIPDHVKLILLSMGEKGKLSRVTNLYMNPVTHALLPGEAAPGQMAVVDVTSLRRKLGMIPRKNYFLFGAPISQSPSPTLHNTGFAFYCLPHVFDRFETEDIKTAVQCLKMNFTEVGGAAVTIPLKQAIVPFLDGLSPAAAEIGAVNTVVVQLDPSSGQKRLFGDNTDWIGMYRCLMTHISRRPLYPRTSLIIGAGGTALAAIYVLRKLNVKITVHNRTDKKAQELVQSFPDGVKACADLGDVPPVDIIICTIPGPAQFNLPAHLFVERPIVLDAVYLPKWTPFLLQAREYACPTVFGIDMLVEQGLEQFRIWTGRRPPRHAISNAVYSFHSQIPQ
eukprot:GILJ01007688.1.p1 GENE.GILJ01007688.1~~GILJ01007688.1.p1  ORF type:complete len:1534 (-),score=263.07 GILJ01007688.1:99-4658(-)